MHRIWATLLVAVFSFSQTDLGVFAARNEHRRLACCRSSGKHHCEMSVGQETLSAPAFQGRCAWYSVSQILPPAPIACTVKALLAASKLCRHR